MSWRSSLGRSGGHGARNQNERIVCILNPAAQGGKAGGRIGQLRQGLDRAFAQWSIEQTEGPGHATELTAKALEGGADIVAAVGGDGTCHEVVNGFFDGKQSRCRRGVFTVIPWGTGSDLSRTIRSPHDLDDALWVAATGMTLPTDVVHLEYSTPDGDTASRVFINVAGFGMNGDVASRANQGSKKLGGRATFLRATIEALLEYGSWDVRLSWEGPDGPGSWEGPVLSTFMANGAYCGVECGLAGEAPCMTPAWMSRCCRQRVWGEASWTPGVSMTGRLGPHGGPVGFAPPHCGQSRLEIRRFCWKWMESSRGSCLFASRCSRRPCSCEVVGWPLRCWRRRPRAGAPDITGSLAFVARMGAVFVSPEPCL